jgi:hypothetical protein
MPNPRRMTCLGPRKSPSSLPLRHQLHPLPHPPLDRTRTGSTRPRSRAGERQKPAINPVSSHTFTRWPILTPSTAARVRRVILKGLPSSWRVPAKILSLVHGGAVENMHISAAGNAIVHFCEPEACKSFYDRYPNGIYLDREKGLSVFVEIGNEVDIISSQLLQYLSVGASRVVRAVGVSENISMGQLHKTSASSNRNVERILDDFVVGEVSAPSLPPFQELGVGSMDEANGSKARNVRTVHFRFCSIDDAARFRGMILRDPDWEHCNVQYAVDP